MRTVDDLLTRAGKETRELAATTWAPPLGPSRRRRRASWPAFAAAFAVVIVAVGLVPWLAGGGDSGTQPSGSIPSEAPTPTSPPSTGDVVECSASGVPVPGDVAGLPDVVAETRRALIDAASACDFDALEAIAGGELFTSFGGGGIDNLETWEAEGRGVLGTLLLVLDMSHAVVDDGEGGDIHVWPAAFAYDQWDAIPDDLLDELETLYTAGELETISTLDSYYGWRTGIAESGDWMFFVAGD